MISSDESRSVRRTFRRFNELSPEEQRKLDRDLRSGIAPYRLAGRMQEEWGRFKDVNRRSLERMIRRYREEFILNPTIKSMLAAGSLDPSSGSVHRFDVVQELIDACILQKGRVEKLRKNEENLPLTLSSVRHEIETYADMMMKLASIEIKLGILKEADRSVSGEVEDLGEGRLGFRFTERAVNQMEEMSNVDLPPELKVIEAKYFERQ